MLHPSIQSQKLAENWMVSLVLHITKYYCCEPALECGRDGGSTDACKHMSIFVWKLLCVWVNWVYGYHTWGYILISHEYYCLYRVGWTGLNCISYRSHIYKSCYSCLCVLWLFWMGGGYNDRDGLCDTILLKCVVAHCLRKEVKQGISNCCSLFG